VRLIFPSLILIFKLLAISVLYYLLETIPEDVGLKPKIVVKIVMNLEGGAGREIRILGLMLRNSFPLGLFQLVI